MRPRHDWMSLLVLLLLVRAVSGAEEAPLPPGDKGPVLRVEAGGPTARVTALVFGPGGKTLYVGGYDKVVRVWRRNARGRFEQAGAYRLPVGPGADGVINALTLSPDGRWLAAAGLGVMRDAGRVSRRSSSRYETRTNQ